MSDIKRVSHFDDEKLERQFDEIISSIREQNKELDKTKKQTGSTVDVEPTIPDKNIIVPKGFTVTPGFKRFVLNWDINNLQEIYYFQVEFSIATSGSSEWQPWQRINEPIKEHFYIHENLDFNFEYQYRVRAITKDGRYSNWTRVVIGGQPQQISLSEEVIGNLDYSNLDPDMRQGFENIAVVNIKISSEKQKFFDFVIF